MTIAADQKIRTGYLRVTEILYAFSNLRFLDKEIVANAAERGSVVHSLCDLETLNVWVSEDDIPTMVRKYCRNDEHFKKEVLKVEGYFESFMKWCKGKSFLDKPERFYDDDHMITGECDLLYKDVDGKIVLVDLKTPANESKTWKLQGSAYSYMAKKTGLTIDRIEFVKLCQKGKFPTVYTYEEDFDLFLKMLETYRYFYGENSQENVLDYI